MHNIQTINTTIRVDDLDDGYEINYALTELLDGEMDMELNALLDAKSNSEYVTIYDEITLDIILENADSAKRQLKEEILNQLETILTKHEFNQESPISDNKNINQADALPKQGEDTVSSVRQVSVSTYFIDSLIQFFRTGSSIHLSNLDQEDQVKQLFEVISNAVIYLTDQLSFLIRIDKSILFRIINFFSIAEIKLLIQNYAKAKQIDKNAFTSLNESIFTLLAIKNEFTEKLILLNSLLFMHEKNITNVDREIAKFSAKIKYYEKQKEFTKELGFIVLSELITEEPEGLIAEMYALSLPYIEASTEYQSTEYSKKAIDIKNKLALEKISYNRIFSEAPSVLEQMEFDEDYINFLITNFNYILRHGSYPYWIVKDEQESITIFKDSLALLLKKYKHEISQKIKTITAIDLNINLAIKSLDEFFDFETRLAFLNIIDDETAHKLDLIQHLFVKFKGSLQHKELHSSIITQIVNNGFNYYKNEITQFLTLICLSQFKFTTVKQLFALFIADLALKKNVDKSIIISDLNLLFDEKDEIRSMFGEFQKTLTTLELFESKGISSTGNFNINQNAVGQDLTVDLVNFIELFISENYATSDSKSGKPKRRKQTDKSNEKALEAQADPFEMLKFKYLDLATIDHFNLPEEVRSFILRLLQTKEAKTRFESTYYILDLIHPESKQDQIASHLKDEAVVISEHTSPEFLDSSILEAYQLLSSELVEILKLEQKVILTEQQIEIIIATFSQVFNEVFSEMKQIQEYLEKFDIKVYFDNLINPVKLEKCTSIDLKNQWHILLLKGILILKDLSIQLKIQSDVELNYEYLSEHAAKSKEIYNKKIKTERAFELKSSMSKNDVSLFDQALYFKLREKFYEAIQSHSSKINTEYTSIALASISFSEILQLSEFYSSNSSFENNLKQIIIQLSKEKNMPVRSMIAALLTNFFERIESLGIPEGQSTIYYKAAFSLYELFIQSLSVTEKISSDQDNKSEYIPTNIAVSEGPEGETHLVSNAGLVICGPFISMLFQRLELLNEKKEFKDNYCLNRAVFILNYLSYGELDVKEYHLSLNNVLCNVPKNFIYDFSIKLTKKEKDTCNSLLENICQQWSALKSTSPDGLRYNFLIRDGSLSFDGGAYKLVVAKKPYDLLLSKIPWTIGTMKLPWMRDFLFTEWG